MNKMLLAVHATFARLTVGAQISLAFGAVLLLAASLGVVSVWSLARLNNSAEALNAKWLSGVGQLSRTRAAIVEAREFEVKHSRATDRSYHSEYEEKFNSAAKAAEGTS